MVTLTPGARLAANTTMELVVSRSTSNRHPTDVWGRPINGNKDGAPGGNFVEIIKPSPAQARQIKVKPVGAVRTFAGAQPGSLVLGAVDAVLRNWVLARSTRRLATSP